MIPYLLFFIFFAMLAIFSNRRNVVGFDYSYNTSFNPLWWLIVISMTLFIGLRFEVGGDWGAYLIYFEDVKNGNFLDLITLSSDIGYLLINWISAKYGLGIYGVNIICGLIFSMGLATFCRSLPRPLLGLVCAIPYLMFVVSMGYSRQGVALGLAMLGLTALGKNMNYKFIFYILLAALFHKSAVVLIPIAVLASTQRRFVTLFMSILIALIIYYSTSFASSADRLIEYYIRNEYQSQGALIRVIMLVIPSIIYLLWPHRFLMIKSEHSIWKIYAWLSIIFLFLLFLSDASTAIDRIALYLLPLQLIIFSYLPEMFGRTGELRHWIIFFIIIYFFLIMMIWFSYSPYAVYWLPYQSILFSNG